MTESEYKLALELNAAQTQIAEMAIGAAQDKARIAQLTAQLSNVAAGQAQAQLATLKAEREKIGEKWTPPEPPSDA